MADNIKKLRIGVIGCGRVSVMHLGSIACLEAGSWKEPMPTKFPELQSFQFKEITSLPLI